MRKIFFILISLIIASCATPNKLSLNNLGEEITCVSPKKEMYIYMDFDRCPLLSRRPTAKDSYWKLSDFNQKTSREKVLQGYGVESKKDCSAGTESTQRYILKTDNRLLVESIVLRADSVSSERLLLYGKLEHNNRNLKWLVDITDNQGLDVLDRIKAKFNICKHL